MRFLAKRLAADQSYANLLVGFCISFRNCGLELWVVRAQHAHSVSHLCEDGILKLAHTPKPKQTDGLLFSILGGSCRGASRGAQGLRVN